MTERDLSSIHESLRALAVDVTTLTPDPRNARLHSERNLKAIEDSLRAHGQRKPIVVQLPSRVVRAGNGTLEAAKRLGWSHVAAVLVEESDADALAFAIRDNRTAELAEWDLEVLSSGMRALNALSVDLEALGFRDYEYTPLLLADEWTRPEKTEMPELTVTLKFTGQQWDTLTGALGEKPTPENILAKLAP